MGGFSRLKRQPSLRHGLSSRMSSFMSQDLDLPWTTSTKDNNNSLQYPTKSSSVVLGKSNNKSNKSNNNKRSTGRLPFKSNKKISIITRGVSPTITVISETSSSSSSSQSSAEEEEGFEIDVSILSSDDTAYNTNLDNSDYINNTNNSNARSGELSSAHSGSLTTFANNCSPPILIPTNFNVEMDIMKSTNGGDGERIIESLSSLDKSSKSRRSSSPKSVRSRLTVTPIVEFCTDNLDETVSDSANEENLSPVSDKIGNLESEVVIESTNNSKDIKEKICHILVDELGSSIETLRSGGSVLSTNTSASSSSDNSEQLKMFILPDDLGNVDSSIETLRSGSASEKIFILPQEEGSRISLDQEAEEKSYASSSSGRSTPQEEQGLQLDIDKLQAYETIMKYLTAYEELSKTAGVEAASTVEVQKRKSQRVKKRSLLDRVGNHLDKKTYQGMMKRSRRRRSRRKRSGLTY